MGAFGISLIYELFYMILIAPGIWEYSLYGAINPEEGISKFIVIFTYFVFFVKVFFIEYYFINFQGWSYDLASIDFDGR